MKKNISLLLIFVASTLAANSQEDSTHYWKKGIETGLGINQVSLSNWAAGGDNSLAGNAFINITANYTKEKHSWDNSAQFAFGLIKNGEQPLRKTDDKLEVMSKYGYKAGKHWFYSTLASFKTQFANGYDYKVSDSVVVSRLLAPAYLMVGLGMDYKPSENFTLFISVISSRLTLVADEKLADAGAFGVDPAEYDANGLLIRHGASSLFELGASIVSEFKAKLMENISLQTRLQLFNDYLKHPENIDVDWKVLLVLTVNKYISANLATNLVYDDNVMITAKDGRTGPRTQFKEVFGVGFNYKF